MDSSRKYDPLQQHISTDDDDPSKKRESEKLVSYIEHFNDLFDFGQYEAAAIHAATSPSAILRTPQAMQKFKEVEIFDGLKSPLFLYCEALMTTSVIDSETFKLSPNMSLECICCALKESGINLAIHWLNHPCIVTSIPLADLLVDWCRCVANCSCKCQALAEGIYRKFDAHQQVATTLARQGKHRAVIEYGRTNGGFKVADYKAILQSNPTIFYAIMLLQSNVTNVNRAES
jgi:clathrin heavy chain